MWNRKKLVVSKKFKDETKLIININFSLSAFGYQKKI
jgi:hypothetical protein